MNFVKNITKELEELKMLDLTSIKRDNIFQSSNYEKFSNNLGKIEQDPFIGYIGKNYYQNNLRICFVGKSNAESKKFRSIDIKINEIFNKFKFSHQNHSSSAYFEYKKVYEKLIPHWKIFKLPEQVMLGLEKNIFDISYANIVPFRYKGSPSIKVYETAFHHYTNKFLNIIKPNLIVPLGKDLKNIFDRFYNGNCSISKGIERVNGDNYICENAREQISELVKEHNEKNKLPI